MYWTECGLDKPITESIDDQFFRFTVSKIPSDTYFRLCYVADLYDVSISSLVLRLLIEMFSSVDFSSSDPHLSSVRLEDIFELEV